MIRQVFDLLIANKTGRQVKNYKSMKKKLLVVAVLGFILINVFSLKAFAWDPISGDTSGKDTVSNHPYQTMARCSGVIRLACTSVTEAYHCSTYYCFVNY